MNSSAQTELSGVTVFDPIILNEPVSSPLGGVGAGAGLAQPATAAINPIIIIKVSGHHHICILLIFDFNG